MKSGDREEGALRRRAEQHGWYLRKATAADQNPGSFVLVDANTREIVHGPRLSIEQVAEWLSQNTVQTDSEQDR